MIVPGVPKILTDRCLSPRTLCFAGRTCTCSGTSTTYIDDTIGCSIGIGIPREWWGWHPQWHPHRLLKLTTFKLCSAFLSCRSHLYLQRYLRHLC